MEIQAVVKSDPSHGCGEDCRSSHRLDGTQTTTAISPPQEDFLVPYRTFDRITGTAELFLAQAIAGKLITMQGFTALDEILLPDIYNVMECPSLRGLWASSFQPDYKPRWSLTTCTGRGRARWCWPGLRCCSHRSRLRQWLLIYASTVLGGMPPAVISTDSCTR